jgi:NADH:ubiquinone oxidoreductase subunit 5 (subunit L)/multisubunit Na+/H+ antiporter MnhA subunit
MGIQATVLAIIGIPLLGSAVIPFLGFTRKGRWTGTVAVALIGAAHLLTWTLLPQALQGTPVSWSLPLFPPAISLSLTVDALAVFMAFTSSLLATLIAIYSLGYIVHDQDEPEYYFIVTLFLGAMMGLVFSTNLILLYLFWEISALACWRLIGYFREPDYVWKADKALLVTVGGAVLMLLGFALLYGQYGTFEIGALRGRPVSAVALALILAGVFSKSATVPLHTWLPDAGVAPSTITSLLHAAILVKIGLYGFARMFCNGLVIPEAWHGWLVGFALLSAFVSAAAALQETNIKRMLAYSTVSQIGYTFLGLFAFTRSGYIGALLYILAHGLAKGGLFLCAGIIEHGTHTKDMTRMGGLVRQMPVTAAAYLVCALSIAGIPPLAGFFGKWFVISGMVDGGFTVMAALAIATAMLTLLYMLRSFHTVFLGEARGEAHREGTPLMVGVVAVLAVLVIVVGLTLPLPHRLAAVAEMQRTAVQVLALGRLP